MNIMLYFLEGNFLLVLPRSSPVSSSNNEMNDIEHKRSIICERDFNSLKIILMGDRSLLQRFASELES